MPPNPKGGPPSMHEGLQMILGEIGTLMATQDADVAFLTQLQHAIVGKIKSSTQHAIGGPGGGNAIGPGGGGGPVGLQAGGAAGMGGPPPGGGPGGPAGGPNPDELRRVLGAQGVQG